MSGARMVRTRALARDVGRLPGEVEGGVAEPLSLVRIVGGGVRARFALAVEKSSRHAVQLGCRREAHDRVGPFLDGALRRQFRFGHHPGIHQRRRMDRIRGDARALQRRRQIEREHHERELALTVREPSIVLAHQHQVVERDRGLTDGCDIDDAGGSAAAKRRQQQMRQQKGREIVHRQPEFMTVAADFPAAARRTEADTGVVDQDVEPVVRRRDFLSQPAHVVERREIGAIVRDLRSWRRSPDLGQGIAPLCVAAAVHEHTRAGGREPRGHVPADTAGSAGDQQRLRR